ncbi:MAG: hypothetical protein E3J37_01800 [Anaerolineales bacterium]|nr:MAG: hypothetical protein E3J37_01800 [Anaerolineales bacterium]
MTKISVITESSAYIPQELVDKYSIRVIPLTVL